MSRRPRKTTRGLPARKTSMRGTTKLPDDSEKLISSSIKDSEDLDAEPVHIHTHSRPKLSPASHHDYSEHELTSVPGPIPDTGLPPPSADTTTLVQSPVSPSQTLVSSSDSQMPSRSTFIPLPSLKTLNLTEVEEAASRSSLVIHSTPTTQPLTVTTAGTDTRDHQSNTPHLSTAAAIALAVSGGLTLFVVAILVKLVRRPNRRRTPTPSLPILHDGTFADKVESEGSPIFGGKECSSPTPQARGAKGNTGLWTWTQYNSGIPKPAPTVTVTRSSSQGQHLNANQGTRQDSVGVVNSDATCVPGQNQDHYPFVGRGTSKAKNQIPLQPVQNAITRAVSRLSTISMSLYPNSPGEYSQVGGDVGLAIDGVGRDERVNGAEPKCKEKTTAPRNRSSMIAPGSTKDAAALRRSQSFAYGGMEPVLAGNTTNRAQLNGGRARIKSTYYTPSAYPRASKQERGDSRRGRDLTSALGLTSPIPPSPQPTLYPDDSMSVIGEAKKVTLMGRSQCESPPTDMAALGSLMMVDFAASKSTASLVNIRPSEGGRGVEDKPPRVPSPPPMPSLAQMALEQEYHSPTYSIYGLYDGERKSRYVD